MELNKKATAERNGSREPPTSAENGLQELHDLQGLPVVSCGNECSHGKGPNTSGPAFCRLSSPADLLQEIHPVLKDPVMEAHGRML